MLLFVLRVVDTPSGGEEEFGEDFAGEAPGQPEPTGKPPLTLASLLSYIYASALAIHLHLSIGIGVASALRHYSVSITREGAVD